MSVKKYTLIKLSLADSNSMAEKTRKSIKLVVNRPGVMCGLCKIHKASMGSCLPFQPISLVLNTLLPTNLQNFWCRL